MTTKRKITPNHCPPSPAPFRLKEGFLEFKGDGKKGGAGLPRAGREVPFNRETPLHSREPRVGAGAARARRTGRERAREERRPPTEQARARGPARGRESGRAREGRRNPAKSAAAQSRRPRRAGPGPLQANPLAPRPAAPSRPSAPAPARGAG